LRERFCAENVTGLKPSTEAAEACGESMGVSATGDPKLEAFGLLARALPSDVPGASTNHMLGRGAFRFRTKEDREDLWTTRK
jgi:hypothetical protein